MHRVLVTGGAGTIGAAVVRRLLRDPEWEVVLPRCRRRPRAALHDRPPVRPLHAASGHRRAAHRDKRPDAWTRTPTHLDDIADGTVIAMGAQAGVGDDFNLAAGEELPAAEIARVCGPALEPAPMLGGAVARHWPSVENAARLLGWQASVDARRGLAALARPGQVAAS